MNYTVDQLELIAIMFKTQFGEKTLDEVFQRKDCGYKGKIEDLHLKRCSTYIYDINFYDRRGEIQMYFNPEKIIIYGEKKGEDIQPDFIVKMLDFKDKV